MKIQVDLNSELWAKFKAKVHHEGKTLGSVVPAIMTPVLEMYLNGTPPIVPHAPHKNTCDKCGREITGIEWLRGDGMVKLCNDCMTVPAKGKFVEEISKEHAPTGTEFPETISLTERTLPTEPPRPEPPPVPTVKRCDLCDQVVDRLFASAGRKVCYACWKNQLSAP